MLTVSEPEVIVLVESRASMAKVKISKGFERDLEAVLKDAMPRSFARLADVYRMERRFDEAESMIRAGLREYPDYASARMVLAMIYYDQGQIEPALIELHTALKCEPGNIRALKLVADIHWESEEYSLARSYYRQVLQLDRYCPDARARISRKSRTGSRNAAEEQQPRGQEGPAVPEANGAALNTVTLARLYASQGHVGLARQVCEGILEKEPDNNRVRDFLNELGVRTGN
jgi:tetratricopeptide (TPR) repeat protein